VSFFFLLSYAALFHFSLVMFMPFIYLFIYLFRPMQRAGSLRTDLLWSAVMG